MPIFYNTIAWCWVALAVPVAVALFFVAAPYGRHVRAGWGLQISHTLGWMIMEGTGLVAFVAFYLGGPYRAAPVPLVLLTLWIVHYAHRAVIFPLRRHQPTRNMPIAICAFATTFQLVNCYLNGTFVSRAAELAACNGACRGRLLVGVSLFAVGLVINFCADELLLRARRRAQGQYVMPQGFLFEWISTPNYLGEILEWIGWAIATWSVAGLSFAIWTLANLLPRARAHHVWLRNRFGDYPERRKVLVPFIY